MLPKGLKLYTIVLWSAPIKIYLNVSRGTHFHRFNLILTATCSRSPLVILFQLCDFSNYLSIKFLNLLVTKASGKAMHFGISTWQGSNFSNSFTGTGSSIVKPVRNYGRGRRIWLLFIDFLLYWSVISFTDCLCSFRYLSCGAWAGKIFCLVMILSFFLWHLLELWEVRPRLVVLDV